MSYSATANGAADAACSYPIVIWTVVAIILMAGLFGGWASYLSTSFSESRSLWPEDASLAQKNGRARLCLAHLVLGVVAAFTVPLFLSLIRSDLMTNIMVQSFSKEYSDLFDLGGFCLVAGFSSRSFVDSLSAKVAALGQQVQRASDTAQHAEEKSEEVQQALQGAGVIEEDTLAENLGSEAGGEVQEKGLEGTDAGLFSRLQLPKSEHAVLKALWEKRTFRRLPKNVAAETGLELAETIRALRRLRDNKLVLRLKHLQTGAAVYKLSSVGAELSGQIFEPSDSQ